MTKMKLRDKPIWHETHLHERGRAIIIAEHPVNCLIRLKGTRQVLKLPWSIIHDKAAQMESDRVKREKKEAKKLKKMGKAVPA